MDWGAWGAFLHENWLYVLIGGLIVLGVISFVRKLLTSILMLILMGLVLMWAFHTYVPQHDLQPSTLATATVDGVVKYLDQIPGTDSTIDKKGNYKIAGGGVTLSGNVKNSGVRVEVLGQKRYIKLDKAAKMQLDKLLDATR